MTSSKRLKTGFVEFAFNRGRTLHQENKVRVVGIIFILASLFLTLIVLFIY